ncbi:hypothetical protein N7540_007316 [Penicillium herquei]|nr:hypothetical protein N7540_007316 [Penicillium herquei]
MPPERRRIILEKSSTVRRRYQRSDQRFRFTAEQLRRIEREELLEKRAKDLREKEQKRIANKKKKVEQETKAREEARKQGLPDPFAPKIPSSQPLLSKFLGFANRAPVSKESPAKELVAEKPSSTPSPEPPITESDVHHDGDAEVDSAAGDTEPDSDCFDDLDEELENEIAALEETGVSEEPKPQPPGLDFFDGLEKELEDRLAALENTAALETPKPQTPDLDCFDDLNEELENEIAALEDTGALEKPKPQTPGLETKNDENLNIFDDDDDEFSDCSAFYDDEIIKKAEAAAVAATQNTHRDIPAPLNSTNTNHTLLQPPPSGPPQMNKSPIISLSDSFRDDTADYLEDVFSRGCGDSFGELLGLDLKPQ